MERRNSVTVAQCIQATAAAVSHPLRRVVDETPSVRPGTTNRMLHCRFTVEGEMTEVPWRRDIERWGRQSHFIHLLYTACELYSLTPVGRSMWPICSLACVHTRPMLCPHRIAVRCVALSCVALRCGAVTSRNAWLYRHILQRNAQTKRHWHIVIKSVYGKGNDFLWITILTKGYSCS